MGLDEDAYERVTEAIDPPRWVGEFSLFEVTPPAGLRGVAVSVTMDGTFPVYVSYAPDGSPCLFGSISARRKTPSGFAVAKPAKHRTARHRPSGRGPAHR